MEVFQVSNKEMEEVDEQGAVYTLDGSLDSYGRPAVRKKTGKWAAAAILLLNQGLATLAFFGVAVNLVLFLTRVLGQTNASAANNVSKWTGTVYMFSLVGAFLSDSYWGRYRSCTIFQLIFFLGLASLSVSTHFFLLKPRGCGDAATPCGEHSSMVTGLFYLSLYLVALGYGGYQPNIATFGADQFDGENHKESHSKVSFFSYFYLALNLGSLFSNTILVYFEDDGIWVIGFWASTASAFAALVLFLIRTPRYRHFKPGGNPFSRFGQVLVAAARNWTVQTEGKTFYESDNKEDSPCAFRKMQHTKGFRFLDKAAIATSYVLDEEEPEHKNPWRLCPITQVEEVKCIIRLIPIWMCTIIYSVVFTQMASLFVVQGAAMTTTVSGFKIPPASMSSFDILSVAAFVFIYRRVLAPLISRMRKNETGGLTELERMGIGLIIAMMAMIASGIVEFYRLKYAQKHCPNCLASVGSSLSILWQIPQYVLVGASEVFMYVGQLEFFNSQTPDGLKSFGSALCMTSMSLGNYVSTLLVSIVMKISTQDKMAGWIPSNLNKGHLDRFYFLLAGLTALDFVAYVLCAKWYEYMKREGITEDDIDDTIAA